MGFRTSNDTRFCQNEIETNNLMFSFDIRPKPYRTKKGVLEKKDSYYQIFVWEPIINILHKLIKLFTEKFVNYWPKVSLKLVKAFVIMYFVRLSLPFSQK